METTFGENIMDKKILLSIIIPAYNMERFIARTLEMLISQNLLDCEVVVVNDGSKDKTFEIAKRVAEKESRIKVISQENKGVSVARNVGMENAVGKYIYFMDADDTLTDGTLDFWRKLLCEKPNFKMYGFGYKSISTGKEKKYIYPKYSKLEIKNPLLKQIFLAKKICFNICSSIYESHFLKQNKLIFTPGLKIGEDVEFILKAMDKTDSLYYDARECFVYLIRDDSAMQGYKSYSLNQFNSFVVVEDYLNKTNFGFVKERNFFIANLYVSQLFYYVRSRCSTSSLNESFISYKNVLHKNIKGKFLRVIFIKIIRFIGIEHILHFFHKQKEPAI